MLVVLIARGHLRMATVLQKVATMPRAITTVLMTMIVTIRTVAVTAVLTILRTVTVVKTTLTTTVAIAVRAARTTVALASSYQVQLQLRVCDAKYADFVVWTKSTMVIERLHEDNESMTNTIEKV